MEYDITYYIAFFVVFILSTTVHEAAHAFVGWKLGDDTAYLGGQVSLDPTPHILREPIGMVVLPIISLLHFAWPMGFASAPYNPHWAYQYPRRAAWMAIAGPLSNFTLCLLAAIGMRIGLELNWFEPPDHLGHFGQVVLPVGDSVLARTIGMVLSMFFVENLVLGAFNLFPAPPLDGSASLPLLLSKESGRKVMDLFNQPYAGLVGLVAAWILFGNLFGPVYEMAFNLLYTGIATYG